MMEFSAFPSPLCAPLKPRYNPIDFPGTANIVCGHRMREPNSNCRYMKQFHDLKKATTLRTGEAEDARDMKRFLHGLAFERRTDKRIVGGKIRRGVEQGMTAYEEDIDIRREKLRALILVEEAALTREVVDQAQHGGDDRLNEMRARTEYLQEQREKNHSATVAAKRMQQYLARCPEARDRYSKRNTKDVKYGNLVQIVEKEARKQSERELDVLWHELMLKEVEAKKFREVEEEKRRANVAKTVVSDLEKQVAGRRALEAEEQRIRQDQQDYLALLWENVRREEIANLEKETRRREKLKKDLEDQLATAKRCLAERAREEAAMDQMFRALGEEELAKEKAKIRDTARALRGELLAYMRNLEDLRQEEAQRRRQVDEIVEHSRRSAEARRDLAVKKFKEARARSLKEVLEGRERQLMEKREEEIAKARKLNEEKEVMEKELEVEKKLGACEEEERRQRALQYGRELKAQQKYREVVRRREKEESDRMNREGIKREKEYKDVTDELLNAPEVITPHAFKILLKECSARSDADRKGVCYCPPPIPHDYR